MSGTPVFENIRVERNGAACWIYFDRPKVLNAMNSALIAETRKALADASLDPEIRVILFAGSGDLAFTAGADIKELRDMTAERVQIYNRNWLNLFREIELCRKPVVAVVHGWATGGGTELSLACDFVVCSADARFGLSEINIGVIPGAGAVVRLTRWVGRLKAKEIVMLGRFISGQEAFDMQLANRCVPREELREAANLLAEELMVKPPLALAAAKSTINFGADAGFDLGLEYELREFVHLFGTHDQKEGMNAFFEKRSANFKGC